MAPLSQPTESMRPLTDDEIARRKRKMLPVVLLGLVAFDAVLLKYFVWDVLEAARAGSDKVSYSMKLVFILGMLPGLVVLGLLSVVLGPKFDDKMKQSAPIRYAMIGLLALPGIALVWWLRQELAALGYHTR